MRKSPGSSGRKMSRWQRKESYLGSAVLFFFAILTFREVTCQYQWTQPSTCTSLGFTYSAGDAWVYNSVRLGDGDADGDDDLWVLGPGGLFIYQNQGNGVWAKYGGAGVNVALTVGSEEYYSTFQLADYNGDGCADFFIRQPTDGGVLYLTTAPFLFNTTVSSLWIAGSWGNPQYYKTIKTKDVDGNGRSDVYYREAEPLTYSVMLNPPPFGATPTGFQSYDSNGYDDPNCYQPLDFANYNGDTLLDVYGYHPDSGFFVCQSISTAPPSWDTQVFFTGTGLTQPQYYETIRYADMNLDGVDDFVVRQSCGITIWDRLAVYLSCGPTLGGPWSDANFYDTADVYTTFELWDIDGDGDKDMVIRSPSGIEIAVNDVSGSAFQSLNVVGGQPFSNIDGWQSPDKYPSLTYGDLDNDPSTFEVVGLDPACGIVSWQLATIPTGIPSFSPSFTSSLTALSTTSPSSSVTISPTVTPTTSPTLSSTETPSLSTTPSFSVSRTPSVSMSSSTTPSVSVTVSSSNTASTSSSVTASFSTSPSRSQTPSGSVTASTSPSATTSPSVTASPSNSATASVSPSASITVSITLSASVTPTPSSTSSYSGSSSLMPSQSGSTSSWPSPIPSNILSITNSASVSLSSSLTASIAKTTSAPKTLTPPKTKTPSTPSPSPSSIVKCNSEEGCLQELGDPCVDLNSKECQRSAGRCEGCETIEYQVTITNPSKNQTYYAVSYEGSYLGSIQLDPGALPKGTTLSLKYWPGLQNEDLVKDQEEGCQASDLLSSPGSWEIKAKDRQGRPIRSLGSHATVQLAIRDKRVLEPDREKACLASTDETKDYWDCDPDKTDLKRLQGDLILVSQKVDHLTSFAVLLGTVSSCSPTLWIVSISLIGGTPLLMFLIALVLSRFHWGKAMIYGYRGDSIARIVKRIEARSGAN